MSPRNEFIDSLATFSDGVTNYNTSVTLSYFDIEQEKAIGLATDWDFEPLGPGECIVPSRFSSYGVIAGVEIDIKVKIGNMFKT